MLRHLDLNLDLSWQSSLPSLPSFFTNKNYQLFFFSLCLAIELFLSLFVIQLNLFCLSSGAKYACELLLHTTTIAFFVLFLCASQSFCLNFVVKFEFVIFYLTVKSVALIIIKILIPAKTNNNQTIKVTFVEKQLFL